MRFKDKVAIVTGASGGIGFAIAQRLGSEGARLVMADHSPEKAEAKVGRVFVDLQKVTKGAERFERASSQHDVHGGAPLKWVRGRV